MADRDSIEVHVDRPSLQPVYIIKKDPRVPHFRQGLMVYDDSEQDSRSASQKQCDRILKPLGVMATFTIIGGLVGLVVEDPMWGGFYGFICAVIGGVICIAGRGKLP